MTIGSRSKDFADLVDLAGLNVDKVASREDRCQLNMQSTLGSEMEVLHDVVVVA